MMADLTNAAAATNTPTFSASTSIDDDVFTEGALLSNRPFHAPSSILKPMAKPVERKLRKFASETSFVQFDSLSHRSLEDGNNDDGEIPVVDERQRQPSAPQPHQHRTHKQHKQSSMPTTLTKRLFTVRPTSANVISGGAVSSRPTTNGVMGRIVSSSSANATSAAVRVRDDSDDASASIASETTVQSGSMTPLSRQKMRFRLQRPKSASHMISSGGSTNALNTSLTSATVHSLDSIQQPLMNVVDVDRRRPSNVFMIDDDSVHEFDDDIAGRYFFFFC